MKCSCLFLYVINFVIAAAAQQCVDTDTITASCSNNSSHQPTADFFAWDVAQPPPLLSALFPNSTQLLSAWEAHPLLSKVSFAQHNQQNDQSTTNNNIPVILHDRSSILPLQSDTDSGDPLLSLLTVDDTTSILSRPLMRNGVDYKLAKKIVHNGEEHLGMLPNPHYSIEEIIAHFHYGGFSVVIDRMHRRWGAVAVQARRLEEELNAIKVGVNMYLTPEVMLETETDKRNGHTRQGFEAHWDWMDVIVIQLSGRKRWSVANEPIVYLSNKDQKRKPTVEEIQHYGDARFSEFTLCPGDAIYIPRGHIHNASTVLLDDDELDHCPSSYPSEEMAKLLNVNGPSLHLTFGIEQSCEGKVESLLHHAINIYFDDNRASKSIAIPAESCSSRSQAATTHDIKWKSILHHALAAVARRDHSCDFPSFRGTDGKQTDCNCLRRSVPLGLSEKTASMQYARLKKVFLHALDIFSSSASITETAEFVQTLQTPPADPDLTYCFPGYSVEDVVACPEALISLRTHEFTQVLMDFHKEASTSFLAALYTMDKFGNGIRERNRKQQLVDLENVAQVNI
mmetsp:Transcript_7211/g.11179  ORF Transcript_7211/g.11179 Transcript_7211/m.11179 type:complete len:568 (-) Transcript_7211:1466-3169(-)